MTFSAAAHRRFQDESGAHSTSTLDAVPSDEPCESPGLFCNHHVATPTDVPPHVWRIHGRDYDLTSFVDDHPGGALFILMGKGLDCTHFFEFYHCFSVPRKRLRQYDVTPDGRKPAVPECGSEFMCDVRAMVREHFGASSCAHGRHKADRLQWTLMWLVGIAEIGAIWLWLATPSVGWGAAAACLNWLLMCNLMHDASHAALSSRPWVNHVGQFLGSAPWACGQAQWWLQHVISHHPNINQVGLDLDVHHWPMARWHHKVEWPWFGQREGQQRVPTRALVAGAWQMFMHVLAHFVATTIMVHVYTIFFVFIPFVAPRAMRSDCMRALGVRGEWDDGRDTDVHHRRAGNYTGQFERLAGNFARQGVLSYAPSLFVGNLVCWLLAIAAILAPIGLSVGRAWDVDPLAGAGYGVALALVPMAVASLCFMLVTQVSHIQEGCQRNETLDEPDPFKRQAQTSLDYSPTSRLTGFLTGGLNLQSIHHLLPSVSCVHYPAMYPKFLAICEKHGCLPDRADGFAHALAKHWSYVYRLGKGDAVPWPEGWPGVRSAA